LRRSTVSEELLINIVIVCKSEFIEMLNLDIQTRFCLFLLIKITVCSLIPKVDEESKLVNAECKTVIWLSLKIYDS